VVSCREYKPSPRSKVKLHTNNPNRWYQ
jgi:hypothetical protein